MDGIISKRGNLVPVMIAFKDIERESECKPRIKKHFEDSIPQTNMHRDEVTNIEVCIFEDPVQREIYETYIINQLK